MGTREWRWILWCLCGLQLLLFFSHAQDRQAGRKVIYDKVRTLRLSQSSQLRSLLELRIHLEQVNETIFEGDNYVNIIPYVTNENGARSNVGLNNFSQSSVFKGTNPEANVAIGLFDQLGNLDRAGTFLVQSNALKQINRVITSLTPISGGGKATSGWLLIFSDEPITAWASVTLDEVNNDPSIELAIADQSFKPAAFVESQGTPSNPLVIQSSVRGPSLAAFKSRLTVVNIGSGNGRVTVKLFDSQGSLLRTLPAVDLNSSGMFISDDIRATNPDTFGHIKIEVEDLDTLDNALPRIVATSLVESTTGPFAGFFPAFVLPQINTPAIAGRWEGSVTGTIMNAEVTVVLFQERDMLYGTFDVDSGTFPTTDRSFLIRGEVVNQTYVLEIQDPFDDCAVSTAPCILFSYRLFSPSIVGNSMSGDTIYFDELNQSDRGIFNLERVAPIFSKAATESVINPEPLIPALQQPFFHGLAAEHEQ